MRDSPCLQPSSHLLRPLAPLRLRGVLPLALLLLLAAAPPLLLRSVRSAAPSLGPPRQPRLEFGIGRHWFSQPVSKRLSKQPRQRLRRGIFRPRRGESNRYPSGKEGFPVTISPNWNDTVDDASACAADTTGRLCNMMYNPINLYVIWYGSWSEAEKGTIRTFLNSFNPTNDKSLTVPLWWNISTLYYGQNGKPVSPFVSLAKEVDDPYSHGFLLGTRRTNAVISTAISSGHLPWDPSGLYMLLTDPFVVQWYRGVGRFCGLTDATAYCGFHDQLTYTYDNGTSVLFPFLMAGNAKYQCSGCDAGSPSINGDAFIDGMVSVIAHEITESATDPYGYGWTTKSGNENADVCADLMLDNITDPSTGALYNQVGIGGSKFWIQPNLNPRTGYCVNTLA